VLLFFAMSCIAYFRLTGAPGDSVSKRFFSASFFKITLRAMVLLPSHERLFFMATATIRRS